MISQYLDAQILPREIVCDACGERISMRVRTEQSSGVVPILVFSCTGPDCSHRHPINSHYLCNARYKKEEQR